jgi:hypothetical protein
MKYHPLLSAKASRRRVVLSLVALGAMPMRSLAQSHGIVEAQFGKPWALPSDQLIEVQVGTDLSTILMAVHQWQVPLSSQLLLRLPDGELAQTSRIDIAHPHGARVAIVGNRDHPDRCRLVWSGATDGLYVGHGSVLGWLDGVTLAHDVKDRRGNGSAILADEGGVVLCGTAVRVRDFYYGMQARRNGVIRARGTAVSGGGDANYFAFMGGHISAQESTSKGARDSTKRLGSGFVAEYSGSIDAEGASAEHNLLDGFTALSGGAIRAYRTRASRNGRSGYFADTGGRIVAHDGRAVGNCGSGLEARDGERSITGSRIDQSQNMAPAEQCAP